MKGCPAVDRDMIVVVAPMYRLTVCNLDLIDGIPRPELVAECDRIGFCFACEDAIEAAGKRCIYCPSRCFEDGFPSENIHVIERAWAGNAVPKMSSHATPRTGLNDVANWQSLRCNVIVVDQGTLPLENFAGASARTLSSPQGAGEYTFPIRGIVKLANRGVILLI
jgi:hypothetical protein